MKTLTNWSIVMDDRNPYQAPELRKQCLTGNLISDIWPISEQPQNIGLRVSPMSCFTTPIVGKSGNCVVTQSGTHYKLLTVAPEYEVLYPGAFERLMNSLQEIKDGNGQS